MLGNITNISDNLSQIGKFSLGFLKFQETFYCERSLYSDYISQFLVMLRTFMENLFVNQ